MSRRVKQEQSKVKLVSRSLRKNAQVYPLYCITAGFCAGALGIAAGTILGPILLELGMMPIVGVASSGFMVTNYMSVD
jgi:uncharacterized membrane protein YfcA